MMKRKLLHLGAIACALSAALATFGGPALATEDPGTPGPGGWEVNLGWAHERRPGEKGDARPIIDINYGVGERIQLKYEIAWLSIRPDNADTITGTGLSIAGVKWRFWENDAAGKSASIFPRLEFRTPGSDSARRGVVPDENSLLLPLQWMQPVGLGLDLLVDVGLALPSRSSEVWFGGIALLRRFDSGVEFAGEVVTEMDHRWHQANASVNLAALFPVTPKAGLLISLGREISNRDGPQATFLGYLGCQLAF